MKPFYEVIKRPLITEKSALMKESLGCYCFEVSLDASKGSIREAVENFFEVKVKDIRTLIVRGNRRRIGRHMGKRPNWKKAIVTLAAGQKIDLFEAK